VENIALLSNAADNGFVGINMYCDDEAAIKELPGNPRATSLVQTCGHALEVRRHPNPTLGPYPPTSLPLTPPLSTRPSPATALSPPPFPPQNPRLGAGARGHLPGACL
jgi:hypothetical protein